MNSRFQAGVFNGRSDRPCLLPNLARHADLKSFLGVTSFDHHRRKWTPLSSSVHTWPEQGCAEASFGPRYVAITRPTRSLRAGFSRPRSLNTDPNQTRVSALDCEAVNATLLRRVQFGINPAAIPIPWPYTSRSSQRTHTAGFRGT